MTKIKITTIVGDLIKQVDCDAIVNSANPSMLAGSGVCGSIHRAAGAELALYGKAFAPLSLGQAVITPGFKLPNRYVIHVSAPKYHLDLDPPKYLALCLSNALKLAEENKIKRIALPAVATGIYGYPVKEAIQVYLETTIQFLHSKVLEEIRFVFNSNEAAQMMRNQFEAMMHSKVTEI